MDQTLYGRAPIMDAVDALKAFHRIPLKEQSAARADLGAAIAAGMEPFKADDGKYYYVRIFP